MKLVDLKLVDLKLVDLKLVDLKLVDLKLVDLKLVDLKLVDLKLEVWCELVRNFGKLFGRVAGKPESLEQSATASGVAQRRSRGGPALLGG